MLHFVYMHILSQITLFNVLICFTTQTVQYVEQFCVPRPTFTKQ